MSQKLNETQSRVESQQKLNTTLAQSNQKLESDIDALTKQQPLLLATLNDLAVTDTETQSRLKALLDSAAKIQQNLDQVTSLVQDTDAREYIRVMQLKQQINAQLLEAQKPLEGAQ